MYSDSYIDEETGNEIIDCCYHGTSGKKIDHSKCFITILCRCAGCGKEIEEAILKRLNSRKDREHMRTLLESLPGEAAPTEAKELKPIIG